MPDLTLMEKVLASMDGRVKLGGPYSVDAQHLARDLKEVVGQRDRAVEALRRALAFIEYSWGEEQVDREEYYAARDDLRAVLAEQEKESE